MSLVMGVPAGCGGSTPATTHPLPPHLTAAVDRALRSTLHRKASGLGLIGASAAVVFADGATWSGGTGAAILKPRERVGEATAFGYRSITKTFFAALTVKLAEKGRLRLDDPVHRWLPSWRGAADATVRDLLGHTAGMPRDLPDGVWERVFADLHQRWSARDVLALAPRPGPRTAGAQYSNLGYNVLGVIVARAARASADVALRRHVLAPLGLEMITDAAATPVRAPVAVGHVYPHGLNDPVAATDGGHRLPAIETVTGTAGALYGSAESLARFGHLLFAGRLLSPASLREMTRFRPLDDTGGGWDSYGLGLGRQTVDGHLVWGHDGDGFGMHAELWYLPRERLSLAAVWNDDAIHTPDLPHALLQAALNPASSRGLAEP